MYSLFSCVKEFGCGKKSYILLELFSENNEIAKRAEDGNQNYLETWAPSLQEAALAANLFLGIIQVAGYLL